MIGRKLEIFKTETKKNKGEDKTDVINIIGKRGSGKTTLIFNYLKNPPKKTSNVLYYSPSSEFDATVQSAKNHIPYNMIFTDKLEDLQEFIKIVTNNAEEAQRLKKPKDHNIIVIDDSSGDAKVFPPGSSKTVLTRAIIASRHINTSFVLALHRFNTCPTIIRDLVNYTYLYAGTTKSNKSIAEETKIDPDVLDYLVKNYLKDPKEFLLIDHDNNKIYYNGLELIWEKKYTNDTKKPNLE